MSSEGARLYPGDAVAALLVTRDGRYVLQQRDDKEGIFFPGFWGNFGGAIESGESPEQALARELREELGVSFESFTHFCRLVMDFRYGNAGEVVRHFFTVPIDASQVDAIVIGEGRAFGVFSGDAILGMAKIVPYDALAIWQHLTRHLIGGRYRPS
jgi:8-oxo-dGTP pyrophosphatase MutT (NUDIX family)